MHYPLVSFITVNYNTTRDTLEFLESAFQLTYPHIEIVVVDNASTEDPGHRIKSKFPTVKYIRSKENLGFAGGNNLGIHASEGEYLFFLNNDTVLFAGFLEPIIDFMQAHPEVGMASPKVLFSGGKIIQYAGSSEINYLGRGNRIGLGENDYGQYNSIYPTALPHGAAVIVPRKIIDEVGLMPEVFFLYYEEHDWCKQIKRKGYQMYYIGTSSVIHKESMSTGGNESYLKVYYLHRNRFLYMRRNSTGIAFFLGVVFYLFIAFPKNLLGYLFRGKLHFVRALFDGLIWNFKF